MNTEQIRKPSATTDSSKFAQAISLEELAAVGTPSGTFRGHNRYCDKNP
jgi:hypothetical protein